MGTAGRHMRPGWGFTIFRLAGLLVLTLTLLGCSTLKPPLPPTTELPLDATQSLSQSLVTTDQGLRAFKLQVRPDQPGNGQLVLSLRAMPEGTLLSTTQLPLAAITQAGTVRLELAEPVARAQTALMAELRLDGDGRLVVRPLQSTMHATT